MLCYVILTLSKSWHNNLVKTLIYLNLRDQYATNMCTIGLMKLIMSLKIQSYFPIVNLRNYLNVNISVKDFKLRQQLTKFRISNHVLEIEIGRHNKVPAHNRICLKCNLHVEDEKHFLLYCSHYQDIRDEFLSSVSDGSCDLSNFNDIMNCKEIQLILSKCISKMFKRRNLI